MKVRVYSDEWYPVLTVDDDDYGNEVDLPDEIVNRYKAACSEFHSAHKAIREAVRQASHVRLLPMSDPTDYACQSNQLSCKVLRDEIERLRARVAELHECLSNLAAAKWCTPEYDQALNEAMRLTPMRASPNE